MYLRQPEERQCGAGQTPKPEGVLTEPTANRLRLALSQLIAQFKMPTAEGEKRPFPRLRNFILDALAEGRRKKIAHVLFEADIGGVKDRLAEHRLDELLHSTFVCEVGDKAGDSRATRVELAGAIVNAIRRRCDGDLETCRMKSSCDRKADTGFAAGSCHHRDLPFHVRRYYRGARAGRRIAGAGHRMARRPAG